MCHDNNANEQPQPPRVLKEEVKPTKLTGISSIFSDWRTGSETTSPAKEAGKTSEYEEIKRFIRDNFKPGTLDIIPGSEADEFQRKVQEVVERNQPITLTPKQVEHFLKLLEQAQETLTIDVKPGKLEGFEGLQGWRKHELESEPSAEAEIIPPEERQYNDGSAGLTSDEE